MNLFTHIRVFFLLLAVLIVSACGDQKLTPLVEGDTILAFGDSLTFGKGTTQDSAYPAVLQELSGYTVINAGISGETTSEGLVRLPELLEQHQPAMVVLFEGGNDILRNLPAANTKANLSRMIQLIKSAGSQLVLVGVPEKSLFSSSAPWYAELAEQFDVPLQDSIVSKLLKKPAMKSDRVHFNSEGYREVAESIYSLLDESGAF